MTPNVWDDDWDDMDAQGHVAYRRRRVVGMDPALGSSDLLGASVWEIPPGATQLPYHFHHAQEEFLLVLRGSPTLRKPEGEETLSEGDVAFFPRGAAGGHQLLNRTEEPVRVFLVSNLVDAEVAEYPDSNKVRVVTRRESQDGERLLKNFRLADAAEFFDGETSR